MQLFKFLGTSPITLLQGGQIISGATSVMWVERYREAGEFEIVAPVSSGLRTFLPIGSLISHIDTLEVMIVENHEIEEPKDEEATIRITGRGFETYLENRIAGSNETAMSSGSALTEYVIPAGYTWNQAVTLINRAIWSTWLYNTNFKLLNVLATNLVAGTGVSEARVIERKSIYENLLDMLEVDNLGIKTIRPGPWSPLPPADMTLVLGIHQGVDRSQQVIFSYEAGEIENAQYLWSNKSEKNSVYITSKWFQIEYNDAPVDYARRQMYLKLEDVDKSFNTLPTGADKTNILARMITLGKQALAANNMVSISKAEISKESSRYLVRRDYDVGDIVAVNGNYDSSAKMRVSEFVEIEDETGSHGYPTLSTI